MSSPEPIDAESGGRKLRYLKGTELFRDFTRAQLEPFHHTIRMETCRAGHVFYRPGETGEVMFLLKEGRAQLYRLAADGRKFVFADVPPSSIFGEMACIGQAMYECFAEATADSVICTLTRADVQRLIVAYPQFAHAPHRDDGSSHGGSREATRRACVQDRRSSPRGASFTGRLAPGSSTDGRIRRSANGSASIARR